MPNLAERLKQRLEALEPGRMEALDALAELYAEQVRFVDPVQKLEGRDAFLRMNRRLLERTRMLRFEVHDAVESTECVFLSWTMRFAFRFGPVFQVEGASRLGIREGRVVEHRDYWDLLEGMAGALPKFRESYKQLAGKWMLGQGRAPVGAQS